METHYICTGTCGAVALEPGICRNESCPMQTQDFAECNCEDGEHAALLNKGKKSSPSERDEEDAMKLDESEPQEWEDKFGDEEMDLK